MAGARFYNLISVNAQILRRQSPMRGKNTFQRGRASTIDRYEKGLSYGAATQMRCVLQPMDLAEDRYFGGVNKVTLTQVQ